MTIAIGLMCRDGMVIAADTHEGSGIPGDLKTTANKIQNSESPYGGAFAVSGAGPAAYLDSIKAKLKDAFIEEPIRGLLAHGQPNEMNNIEALESEFGGILYEFYTKHVLTPYERPVQNFDLIIAVARNNGIKRLWTTSERVMVVTEHMEPAAVGAGANYAHNLMTHYWPFKSMQETVLFAAYVIYRVKKTVESCGDYTQITCIATTNAKPNIKLIPVWETKIMEHQFARYRALEGNILDYALGRETKDEAKLRETLMKSLDSIRAAVRTKVETEPDIISELWNLWK